MPPDDPASVALARALGPATAHGTGSLVGLEHEFVVRDSAGQRVDVRTLLDAIVPDRRRLDPGDPNAHRLRSGSVITADGAEAEVAIPPARGAGAVGARVAADAARARVALTRRLPAGHRLEGYSTHVSVSATPGDADRLASRYPTTFGPALMLLMDRAHSPGLLVRPRPGRLELGGEYVSGLALRAVVTFALGSVRALDVAAASARPLGLAELDGRIRAADQRFGWFVSRRAFGGDLYATGRATILPRSGGGAIRAADHLAAAWRVARAALAADGSVATDEIRLVDEVVAGRLPIPLEGAPHRPHVPHPPSSGPERAPRTPFGSALRTRIRPGYGVTPVMLMWDLAVFLVRATGRDRRVFAAIPGDRLGAFLDALDTGSLDALLAGDLARPPAGRHLARHGDAAAPGLWDMLGPRVFLLAPERPPERAAGRSELGAAA